MAARFVRLGIAGFKSFADAVALDIQPGLTGIVGPNGCGKSNVAEALRWAMGEANARTLRGGEMDDIIFAGTANRPSRNLAEVSLAVEADGSELPPPFSTLPELQVTRRLERGSGSNYRVNGREARARDVQTLFADMASGARSSAMVSQGRVGTLVNARPEDRRSVLEEAAGITGLHARRAEAETRLRAAETNLERAEERRGLLEQQIAGLRTQAKQAARYRTVMQAVQETEALLLATMRARATAQRDAAEAARDRAQAAIHDTLGAARRAEQEARTRHEAVSALRDAEAGLRSQLERARLAEEGIAAEVGRAQAALQGAAQRQAQASRDLAHARSILDDADAADQRLVSETERLRAEQAAAPHAIESARQTAEAAASALAEADQASTERAARAAQASAQAEALRQALQQAEARARRVDEALTRWQAEHARAAAQAIPPAQLDQAAAGLAAADKALARARTSQDQTEADHAAAVPAAAAARDAFAKLDAFRQRIAAEASALAEVLAVGDGERWAPMVDRLEVPPGLEAALGAALGEELAASDDLAAARHWRPLPALPAGPATLPGQAMNRLVAAPPLLARALGGIAVVEDDAQGDAGHAALRPGQSLVSRAGAVWRWDGYTVRAGTPTAAAVRLQQRNRLNGLRSRLDTARQEAEAARLARDSADAAERAALSAQAQARTDRRTAETAAERARAAAHTLRSQSDTASARLAALQQQREGLTPEYEAAHAALAVARRAHAEAPDPGTLQRQATEARAAVMAARARDAAATKALDALQRATAARQARLGHIGREREDRRMRAAELRGRVTDLAARVTEAEAEQAHLAAVPARATAAMEQAKHALAALQADHTQAARALAEAERAATEQAAATRAAEHAVFAAREALVRAEAAVDAAAQGWAAAEARIGERDGALPPLPAGAAATQEAEDRARTRLQRLTRERDDIGPVNLRAEIEAEAVATDIATIERERDELGTAIAKLRGSIGHLNREGRERLSAVFQQVDRHFQALFSRMFGGGRAHLALVGSDDPLQAGLEIYAQPPGKKLTALSLLSGGEQALTALSLIFAVFRCNPAPLCMLDEVDAPLDDANVERFCDLLAEMVKETGTRFLVVTHHQLTMARMDRLYGVTMQERGVSRLLSVDLTGATRMIEAVAAE